MGTIKDRNGMDLTEAERKKEKRIKRNENTHLWIDQLNRKLTRKHKL